MLLMKSEKETIKKTTTNKKRHIADERSRIEKEKLLLRGSTIYEWKGSVLSSIKNWLC